MITRFLLLTSIAFASSASAARGPHGFIENSGQLRDQFGQPTPQVRYLRPIGKGVNVQVHADGLSYDMYRKAGDGRASFRRMDMRFVGIEAGAAFVARDQRSELLHFMGREAVRGVRQYDAVTVQGVYPGIDVELRITEDDGLKYDIVLRNSADLTKVRMRYAGYDHVRLHGDEVVFTVDGREFTEHIPASWVGVDQRPVQVAYTIVEQADDHVVLGLHRADPIDSPRLVSLTVDPSVHFSWGTYIGGEGDDAVRAVDVDDVGMIYATGRTAGLLSTITTGPYQGELAGGEADAFLAKIAPHGSRLFTTYFGGEGDDEGLGIDVDNLYRVRVVGRTTSSAGIVSDTAAQSGNAGGDDAFIARFDSTGNLIWSVRLGGSSDDQALAVRGLAEGRAIVCGTTRSPDLFDAIAIAPVSPYTDSLDAFVLWIDDAGELTHAGFLGGEGDDALVAVALFPDGTAYFAGHTRSTLGISDTIALSGPRDGWLCAADTALNLLWSRYVGGDGDDALTGIARRSIDLVACGSARPPELQDTIAPAINGAMDALIARVLIDGGIDTLFHKGGPGSERAVGVRSNASGLYFVAAVVDSASCIYFDPDTGEYDTLLVGAQAQLLVFTPDDALLMDRMFGGDGDDEVHALGAYRTSAVTMGGSTRSEWGVAGGGFQMTPPGEEDGFLARFTTDFSAPCNGIGPPGGGCQPGGCSEWNSDWCGGNAPAFPHIYLCRGDTFTLCAQGGYLPFGHYWYWYADECGDPQQFLFLGDCYTFVVQDDFRLWVRAEGPLSTSSCTGLDIRVEDYPVATAEAPGFICQGDSIPLNGSGGVSQLWEGPSGFSLAAASAMAPTNGLAGMASFTFTAFSLHECASQQSVSVVIAEPPSVEWSITPVSCHDGADGAIAADSLSAGLFSFLWAISGSTDPLVSGLNAGAYTVSYSDTLGCASSDTILVAEPIHPLDTLLIGTATCGQANGSVQVLLHAEAGAFEFAWLPDGGNGAALSGLAAGAYSAQISNDLGCTFSFTAFVGDTGSVAVWASPDTITVYMGDSTEVSASFAPYDPQASIVWSPAEGLSCASCPVTMASPVADATYTVQVTNGLGCTGSDTVRVMVVIPPEPAFFLPTHFSPNADGLNDRFEPLGGSYARIRMVIAEREGHEVFVGDGQRPAWDGSVSGAPARQGVYTVLLECARRDGGIETHRAQLQLVR